MNLIGDPNAVIEQLHAQNQKPAQNEGNQSRAEQTLDQSKISKGLDESQGQPSPDKKSSKSGTVSKQKSTDSNILPQWNQGSVDGDEQDNLLFLDKYNMNKEGAEKGSNTKKQGSKVPEKNVDQKVMESIEAIKQKRDGIKQKKQLEKQ